MNSCPASVASLYNFGLFPRQSNQFDVRNIVKSIPLPNKPNYQFVVWSFRVIFGIVNRDFSGAITLIAYKPFVFNKPSVTVAGNPNISRIGITPLEFQMFSVAIMREGNAAVLGIEIKR
jgi:hypothetical protein